MPNIVRTSSEALEYELQLLRRSCARLEGLPFSLISLSGEDRKEWLQGQVTNDMNRVSLGGSGSACVCEPTGQILTVTDIWSLRDRYLMTIPVSTTTAFLKRVEQMVIMEDVVAEDLTADFTLISFQGPQSSDLLRSVITIPSLDAGPSRIGDVEIYCMRSNRTGVGGWDVWVPAGENQAICELQFLAELAGPETYEVARLEAGIAEFGKDITTKSLPPELGPAFTTRYVSYTKGCYTGQEVLMRIHSRGHTNKTWVGLLCRSAVAPGMVVTSQDGKEVGQVTSAAHSPGLGWIAGAMLRNQAAEPGTTVSVGEPAEPVEAEVRAMPLLELA